MNWGKMSRAERDAAYNNSNAVKNSPALNEARIGIGCVPQGPSASISTSPMGRGAQ